jgi:hypothetical protein
MEAQMSKELTLRCYGVKTSSGNWEGVCLEFNLATQADTLEQLKQKMYEVITSYIESVFDTDDKASIPKLLNRKAPFKDYFFYYLIKSIRKIKDIPTRIIFQELAPLPA